MAGRKPSISVLSQIERIIRAAATEKCQFISSWMAEAAVQRARADAQHAEALAAAQAMVDEYEAEYGPIPEAERQRVRRFITQYELPDDMR